MNPLQNNFSAKFASLYEFNDQTDINPEIMPYLKQLCDKIWVVFIMTNHEGVALLVEICAHKKCLS